MLARTGLAPYVDSALSSEAAQSCKPHPAIFAEALRRAGCAPHEALFVGDTPREDVAGPQFVGMRTAWISKDAAGVPEGIPQPHFTIRDLAELPGILGI